MFCVWDQQAPDDYGKLPEEQELICKTDYLTAMSEIQSSKISVDCKIMNPVTDVPFGCQRCDNISVELKRTTLRKLSTRFHVGKHFVLPNANNMSFCAFSFGNYQTDNCYQIRNGSCLPQIHNLERIGLSRKHMPQSVNDIASFIRPRNNENIVKKVSDSLQVHSSENDVYLNSENSDTLVRLEHSDNRLVPAMCYNDQSCVRRKCHVPVCPRFTKQSSSLPCCTHKDDIDNKRSSRCPSSVGICTRDTDGDFHKSFHRSQLTGNLSQRQRDLAVTRDQAIENSLQPLENDECKRPRNRYSFNKNKLD